MYAFIREKGNDYCHIKFTFYVFDPILSHLGNDYLSLFESK